MLVCAHVCVWNEGWFPTYYVLGWGLSIAAAKYDAEKEAKEKKDAKDKQLAKIEEARRKAAEDKCMSELVEIQAAEYMYMYMYDVPSY